MMIPAIMAPYGFDWKTSSKSNLNKRRFLLFSSCFAQAIRAPTRTDDSRPRRRSKLEARLG
jgi:hypothetical protein